MGPTKISRDNMLYNIIPYLDLKSLNAVSILNKEFNDLSKDKTFYENVIDLDSFKFWKLDISHSDSIPKKMKTIAIIASNIFVFDKVEFVAERICQISDFFSEKQLFKFNKNSFCIVPQNNERDESLKEGTLIDHSTIYGRDILKISEQTKKRENVVRSIDFLEFDAESELILDSEHAFESINAIKKDFISFRVEDFYGKYESSEIIGDIFSRNVNNKRKNFLSPLASGQTKSEQIIAKLNQQFQKWLELPENANISDYEFTKYKAGLLSDYLMGAFAHVNKGFKVIGALSISFESPAQKQLRHLFEYIISENIELSPSVLEFAIDYCSDDCIQLLVDAKLFPTSLAFERALNTRGINVITILCRVIAQRMTFEPTLFEAEEWKKTLVSCLVIPIERGQFEVIELLIEHQITYPTENLCLYAKQKFPGDLFKKTLELLESGKRSLEKDCPPSPEEQHFDKRLRK